MKMIIDIWNSNPVMAVVLGLIALVVPGGMAIVCIFVSMMRRYALNKALELFEGVVQTFSRINYFSVVVIGKPTKTKGEYHEQR